MRFIDLAALVSLPLFTVACVPDKGGDDSSETGSVDTSVAETTAPTEATETSGSEGGTTGPGPAPAVCECPTNDPCMELLCEQVRWVDDNGDGALDAAAVDAYKKTSECALTAMRDRAVGRIAWESEVDGVEEYGVFYMFGDGNAVQMRGGVEGSCVYELEAFGYGPLQPTDVFADCLADDLEGRFGCIRGAGDGMAAVCEEGVKRCDGA